MKNNKNFRLISQFSAAFLLLVILQVGVVSALEFDNVGTYYPETRTMEITNLFGLGSPIANVTLLSPLEVKVMRGEERLVAWYQIDNFGSYDGSEIFSIVDTYDLRRGKSVIQKNMKFKKQHIEEIEVVNYEDVCIVNATDNICNRVPNGMTTKEIINWKAFNINSDLLEGTEIIGLFTEVEAGEKVDWIPNMYGVEIEEWAAWTESMNEGLKVFYQLNETAGVASAEATGSMTPTDMHLNLTNTEDADWIPGVFGNAINFSDADESAISNNNIGLTGQSERTVCGLVYAFDAGGAGMVFEIASGTATKTMFGLGLQGGAYDRLTYYGEGWEKLAPTGSFTSYNSWQQVCYGYNSTSLFIFHNTTLRVAADLSTLNVGDSPLRIGNTLVPGWGSNVFGIDEVGVWNRSLSEAEISDLYNDGNFLTYTNFFPIAPVVTLNSPIDYYNSTSSSITFNCSALDGEGTTDAISLYINGS